MKDIYLPDKSGKTYLNIHRSDHAIIKATGQRWDYTMKEIIHVVAQALEQFDSAEDFVAALQSCPTCGAEKGENDDND